MITTQDLINNLLLYKHSSNLIVIIEERPSGLSCNVHLCWVLNFLSLLCKFSRIYFYSFDLLLSPHLLYITSCLKSESEGNNTFCLL